jgi:hypothetical protein
LPGTIFGVRNMTGRTYLRRQWASWVGGVICTVMIALWISWAAAVVLAVFLLYGIRVNLTAGRRVAERIDAKRER